jgi:RNA polymerase sigma factor (sigma-70 family)
MSGTLTPIRHLPDGPALIAQMRPALVKYFRRKCGSVSEAEDLAQDVLLRVLRHAVWKSADEAKGYMFRVAVNRWHDRNRRVQTRGVTVDWDDTAPYARDGEKSPERVLVVEQELESIAQALKELNERTQDVFMLVRLEHMKQADIAAMLHISVSAVEKHLAKAVAHLARCIGRSSLSP